MEKIILNGKFNGLATKKDGLVDIKFKFVSDELVGCLGVFKFIGKKVDLAVKIEGETITVIGEVVFGGFACDKQAVTVIKLTGDSSELNLSELTTKGIDKLMKVRLQSENV